VNLHIMYKFTLWPRKITAKPSTRRFANTSNSAPSAAKSTTGSRSSRTLNRLCGFVSNVPWGLTDACRVVLKNAGKPMTPTDVRDRLEAIGVDLSKYTNSLAAVHTVLKRLNQAQEVLFVEQPSGKFACEWRPSIRPVLFAESTLAAHLASHAAPEPRRKRRKKT